MKLLLFFCLLLPFALQSCRDEPPQKEAERLMGSWYKKKLLFPDKIELLNKNSAGQEYHNRIDTLSASAYIVHFFMADCDKCIENLVAARKFIQKHSDLKNLGYIFIVSGPTRIYAQQAVDKLGFEFPVYYEEEYHSFKRLNNLPLADPLYNTILINKRREILLFGSAFDNGKAEDLYLQLLQSPKALE